MNKPQTAKERLIVALDTSDAEQALDWAKKLAPYCGAFKVGLQLYLSHGNELLKKLTSELGARIFLDLKLHDIPNTVSGATSALARLGVWMFNVHASGGSAMIAAARRAIDETVKNENKPILLAVTVLTSLDEQDLNSIGFADTAQNLVVRLASLAKKAGADGVVASPREAKAIRETCGNDFIIVTPGVRPKTSEKSDQKRTATPAEAVAAGADYIVVGRPITRAENPQKSAASIVAELEGSIK